MVQTEQPSIPEQYLWYAVRVRPQHEVIASRSLKSRGLEEFLPMYASRRRWADRAKIINCPLFTGYVFCRFVSAQKTLVLASAGCVQILKCGPTPSPIPDEDIGALRRLVESGRASPSPYVSEGQRVRICSGAFKDIEGYVQKVQNQHSLVVSLHLLQRSASVHIEADAVEVI